MENTVIREATDTFKKLTPQNQDYFMTLLRVAAVAEDAVKESKKVTTVKDVKKEQGAVKKSKRAINR